MPPPAPDGDLVLPQHLRHLLARPFGPVVQTSKLTAAVAGRPVAAVGDVVAVTCLDLGIEPRIVVCDLGTQRGGLDPVFQERLAAWGDRQVHVANPAGGVTREAWQAVAEALRATGRTCVIVSGEEDLVGLPVLCEAPDGWVMLYGMPGQGVVITDVAGVRDEARRVVAAMAGAGPP